MPLVPCPTCRREIDSHADKCPHCGRVSRAVVVGRMLPGIVVLVFVVFVVSMLKC